MKPFSKFSFLKRIREKHALSRIVLAGGCFDLFHAGHLKYLQFCKQQGDILVVHVGSDKALWKFKRKKSFIPDLQRLVIIKNLKPVDFVFLDDGKHTDLQIIKALQPDVLVISKESESSKLTDLEEVKKARPSIEIVYNPRKDDGLSTSGIIAKVQKKV